MARLARIAAAAALVAAVAATPAAADPVGGTRSSRSTETTTPIKHFITLMQENHTFDNYFGTYPGADGIPAGTCMPSGKKGQCVRPWHIGTSGIEDLNHDEPTFRRQYDHGRMDGFITADAGTHMSNPALPMGYYDRSDLPYYWNVANQFVLFDHNFTSAHYGSFINHVFWVSARPGARNEAIPPGGFTVPTIFDELQQAGISWKFYVQSYDPSVTFRSSISGVRPSQVTWCPLLAFARFIDDPQLNKHIVPLDDYYKDLDDNTLPAVSFMVPAGSSEHPPGSLAAGESFVSDLITSLMRSSSWSSSSFLWSYDDWGGWYDHVKPPQVDRYGLGFRAPALLVSPYAKQGFVDHTPTDFTSQLKFIEQNWGLKPLSRRDAEANGLGSAFDFTQEPRPAKFVSPDLSPPVVNVHGQGVVYASYGAGLLLAVGVSLGTLRYTRRRGRRRTEAARR